MLPLTISSQNFCKDTLTHQTLLDFDDVITQCCLNFLKFRELLEFIHLHPYGHYVSGHNIVFTKYEISHLSGTKLFLSFVYCVEGMNSSICQKEKAPLEVETGKPAMVQQNTRLCAERSERKMGVRGLATKKIFQSHTL